MKKNSKYLALVILDLIVFGLMVLGISFSIFDVRFMGDYPRLSTLPILMTFTGLSNLFIGLICLGCSIYRIVNKRMDIPPFLFLLKIIALAEITITFVITATYLAPQLGSSWWRLYINNNIFNHFLTPIVAIITFIVLEEYNEIPFKHCYFAFAPIIIYGMIYLLNILDHRKADGSFDLSYDIYGFARFGIFIFILFFIAFMGISFGFTVLYRLQNKQKRKV